MGKEGAGTATATGTAWVARAKRRVESVRCLWEYMVNCIFCQVRADEIADVDLIEALGWLPALFYVEKKSFGHDGCWFAFISARIYQHSTCSVRHSIANEHFYSRTFSNLGIATHSTRTRLPDAFPRRRNYTVKRRMSAKLCWLMRVVSRGVND